MSSQHLCLTKLPTAIFVGPVLWVSSFISYLILFIAENEEMFAVSMVYREWHVLLLHVRHCLNRTKEDGAWCEVGRSLQKLPLKESW